MEEVQFIKETWENFGNQLNNFLNEYGDKLRNFNILIGFTRGGMILATALCTLLRDKYGTTEGELSYALRSIPGGFTLKSYREPCFAMSTPMEKEEEEDAEVLITEIENIHNRFHRKKLNILLIDDNLTGATRLFAYKRFLKERLPYANVRTLGYKRLECFKHPSLDFLIAGYVPADKYFVMPWHKVHEPLNLPSSRTSPIYLILRTSMGLEEMLTELRKVIGKFGLIKNKHDRYILIQRGASIIYIAKKSYGVTLRFPFAKYYPPKRCLESKLIRGVNTFREYSLCSLGAKKADSICFYCSSLNCNVDILRAISNRNSTAKFEVKQEGSREDILLLAVKRWLEKFENYKD